MNKWISINDEMPEERKDILLWCGWCLTGYYTGTVFYTADSVDVIRHVTHWTTLPDPPEND